MIAILVASLVEGFSGLDSGGKRWKIDVEQPKDRLPPLGTALKSGREDYLGLFYRRVK
ncbi:hypothetical protein H2198_002943 [Neophaeococcomyces mojaviensis]|uniref:Uncharacterized protein n=1 Tax=Neophaeococcomyces mojaviensis TaxID=3383035 RepID=A0ACC3ADI3_9EURO|nr:hypothetical protein H2198_002943 [Knufia sp. JES_112]